MFLKLYLKSKNKQSLIKFLKTVLKIFKNFVYLKPKYKMTKKKIFTVFKSPHVHNKSKEQFEYCIYIALIKIHVICVEKFFFILKLIKTKLLTDLTIKINYTLEFSKNYNLKIIILNPNNYVLKNKPKSNYIKIFELYGELNLLKMKKIFLV